MCYWEKNTVKNLKSTHLLTVLLSIPLNYLPWMYHANEFSNNSMRGYKNVYGIYLVHYILYFCPIRNFRLSAWKFLFDSSWPIKRIAKDIAISCKKVNRKSGDVRFLKGGVAVDRSNISASKKSAESFLKFYGTNRDFMSLKKCC